ncbi:MAG: DNA-binding response regulator [Ignavibacteria bacterium 13_1_40CM_2_61_4]|nr:MAG: DNA-binding response regulator [Ignavibacteria bacterium 13_1_40CM_2_61_4]
MKKVLIIEDEPEMVRGLRHNFEFEGYQVCVARDGEAAINETLHNNPDIILLDVMLPKLSGLDVCRHLRAKGVTTPIIMLTARGQETDKVVGLEVGADDYGTKPFSIKELLARVRAQLRRATNGVRTLERYKFADVELDFRKYRAARGGRPIDLSPREFELLKCLILHENEIVTRDQLLDEVWGLENYPITRTVDNHIAKLRQKIEGSPSDPQHIITVHRIGYKFAS